MFHLPPDTGKGRHGDAGKCPKPEIQNLKLKSKSDLTLRFMHEGEERAVCNLVHKTFDLTVAPLYSKKGLLNFKKYADPGEMLQRVNMNHFVLVALLGRELVGMIEMRSYNHVSLLFVEPQCHGRGIAGNLLKSAIEFCLIRNPDLMEVTVNSSPNAVNAYKRMGFMSIGGEQTINGVRSVPMRKVL